MKYGKTYTPQGEKKRSIVIQDKNSLKEAPNIWKVNPSFKHSNSSLTLIRIISLALLIVFFVCSTYILTSHLYLALGFGTAILVLFILVFHDQFFILKDIFPISFQRTINLSPFKDFIFFFDNKDESILYFTNKKDLVNIGLKIFKVEVIPENIHASVNFFVKGLSEFKNMVSFSYQVIQTPFIKSESIQTSIYFCVYHAVNGSFILSKLESLRETLQKLGGILRSNFTGNFHHFQISQLSGLELTNALRTYLFRIPTPVVDDNRRVKFTLTGHDLVKFTFLALLIVISGGFLLFLKIELIYVFLISIIIFGVIIYLWWRELLLFTSRKFWLKEDHFRLINPFSDLKFFRYRGVSDTIFISIDNKILVGIKMLNLAFTFPPSYCRADKFIQAIMNQKISFGYTCMNIPVDYRTFCKEGLDYLTEKSKSGLLKSPWRVQTKLDEINWLAMRSGIWKTMLIISTYDFEITDSLTKESFLTLEERLTLKTQLLFNAFNINFLNYELIQLSKRKLISGIQCEIFKNNVFNRNGTHLNYLLLQGKALTYLIEIVDELKKGITTRIASEFNTPLQLENYISVGHTINTEVLEEEMPFGFTREQVFNILILNGTIFSREYLSMKLISELVNSGIPALIFDFRGTWSKLIRYFKGTRFEDQFLYFKLGRAFSLDPLTSDIPYDTDNIEFLNYMYDAYRLAFRKDQRTIDQIKETISKNSSLGTRMFNIKLKNKNTWENIPASDTLLNLFDDFTNQDEKYLKFLPSKPSETITFQKFIDTDKTVIIDLSISNEFSKQIFLMFLIISKIIHYLSSEELKAFVPKILVLPHIDLFFQRFFLDTRADYGKINKFLDPLIEKGFGFISSANQVHYLHYNLIKYFENIVTFKTRDNRDIGALSKIMNLQELEGVGYYSRSRNQTYQIRYLMSMQPNEAIVKRSDTYQSFPVCFRWEDIEECNTLEYDEIIEYMDQQGYNLRDAERTLLAQIKKTLFEKDLGGFSSFIDEVKQFLRSVEVVDQIGNLHESKLKKELKVIIYPKASKIFTTKPEIKKCRDELFNILVRQGYLVESHPNMASGSESIRTSYSVGDQYQKALEDEAEVNQPYSLEPLEGESEHFQMNSDQPRKHIIQKKNMKKAIARELSNFLFELFTVYEFVMKEDYKNALKIEYDLVRRFLIELYKHYYNVNQVSDINLTEFIDHLLTDPHLPFTKEELKKLICQTIDFDKNDPQSHAEEIYQFVSLFFEKIQAYIYREGD
ncbi:MAG: hypothetical protein ACFFEN_08620 [Candidatus Thorarchaeota archaeon]